ncbi:hypothetical protein B0H21DRAFT_757635 [Amylocystis lapponica]|nr:hypothetical protein B0H21DRAFT_757635 [Amylocystis lapponica]
MEACEVANEPMIARPHASDASNDIQPVLIVHEPIVRDYALTGSQIVSAVGPPLQKKTRFVFPEGSKAAADSEHTGQSNARKTDSSKQKTSSGKSGKKLSQQRQWRHMVLGYVVPRDIAAERAAAMWGTDRAPHELAFRYAVWVTQRCELISKGRINLHVVYVDKKTQDTDFCITLAQNTSAKAMVLPSQEKIDKLKQLIQTEEPPQWWEFFA